MFLNKLKKYPVILSLILFVFLCRAYSAESYSGFKELIEKDDINNAISYIEDAGNSLTAKEKAGYYETIGGRFENRNDFAHAVECYEKAIRLKGSEEVLKRLLYLKEYIKKIDEVNKAYRESEEKKKIEVRADNLKRMAALRRFGLKAGFIYEFTGVFDNYRVNASRGFMTGIYSNWPVNENLGFETGINLSYIFRNFGTEDIISSSTLSMMIPALLNVYMYDDNRVLSSFFIIGTSFKTDISRQVTREGVTDLGTKKTDTLGESMDVFDNYRQVLTLGYAMLGDVLDTGIYTRVCVDQELFSTGGGFAASTISIQVIFSK